MSNALVGRDFMLQHSDDGGTTWKVVGPVVGRSPSVATPNQDVTDQSSDGPNSEFCPTGYAQFSIAVTGVVNEKSGTDTGSGLDLMTYKELAAIANNVSIAARKGLFKLVDTLESYEDVCLISEWSRDGDRSSIQEFSMTLTGSGEAYAYNQIP